MSDTNHKTSLPPLVDTEQIWDDVSERIEAFIAAWNSEAPPRIDEFLAAPGAASRTFTLIELIKIDLERRWEGDAARYTLADYVREFPEIAAEGGVPADLIYEELHIRKRCGDEVDLDEYLSAHPQQADEIRRMLQYENQEATTQLHRGNVAHVVRPGDQLGDFDLLTRLGRGAFASVFLARQMSMQRMVAVKVSADRGREPQTLARLDHPNIVRVYDQQVLPERGLRLLYMQYVPGGTLQELLKWMRKHRPRGEWSGQTILHGIDYRLDDQGAEIPRDSVQRKRLAGMRWSETVCQLCLQLAEALHYAHEQGVLHRDIKPANILVSETAIPKLVDFNISSCSKLEGANASAYFGGSLAYMSPEQMEASNPGHARPAESLDGRSDVYTLGVVMWEMLIGERPFRDPAPSRGWSASLDELTAIRRTGITAEQWEQLPDDIPDGVREVLWKCLVPNVDQRFASAAHLADGLRICLHPDAQKLLAPPTGGLRQFIGRWPMLTMVLTVVLPNLLASWLNYRFNYETVVVPLRKSVEIYDATMVLTNGIAFPVGLIVGIWLMRHEAREVRHRTRGGAEQPAPRSQRHHCLRLGHYLALVGIVLWSVSGVIFPLAMSSGGHPLKGADALQWCLSLVACGIIGAAGPFFGATAMLVEVWFPALVLPRTVSLSDVEVFKWLERISARYLVMSAAVPLLSLGVLSVRGQTDSPWILIVLSLGGLVLFGLVFLLWRRLHHVLSAFTELALAKDEFL